jgi:circadian clock protein KaiC
MAYKTEKIKTGMDELDKILIGGIPKGNTVLITGATGTGKTIFCLEYVYKGAKIFKEPSVYITTEQNEEDLIKQLKTFGWNPEPLVKKNLLRIVKIDITKGDNYIDRITKIVKQMKAKRLVVDSLTTLTEFFISADIDEKKGVELIKTIESIIPVPLSESLVAKTTLFKLIGELKNLNCTTLLTSELPEQGNWLSRDTVSEFICDGVIILRYLEYAAGGMPRSILVRKMRGTKYDTNVFSMDITDAGIKILPLKRGIVI